MGKLLDKNFIENEKKNPRIDFDQEYGGKFTTSLSAAFKEDEIMFEDTPINMYEDLWRGDMCASDVVIVETK